MHLDSRVVGSFLKLYLTFLQAFRNRGRRGRRHIRMRAFALHDSADRPQIRDLGFVPSMVGLRKQLKFKFIQIQQNCVQQVMVNFSSLHFGFGHQMAPLIIAHLTSIFRSSLHLTRPNINISKLTSPSSPNFKYS